MDKTYSADEIVSIASRRWGVNLKKIGGEWHGAPCPKCGQGEHDKIWVRENGGVTCRDCGHIGWLEDDVKNFQPDPEAYHKHLVYVAEIKAARMNKSKEWSDGFVAGAMWQKWHDQMTEFNREWFRKRGFDDFLIDLYGTGFLPNKKVKYSDKAGNEYLSEMPVYTYPARDPNDWDKIRNVHYRVADPPENCGKYRMEYGIIPYPFFANPNQSRSLIIVEGANKAGVVFDRIDGAAQVMGNSGMDLCSEVIEEVNRDYDEKWICLDPGANREVKSRKMKSQLADARIVYLPEKPDDLFLNGCTKSQFREYFRQTRDR